jgi:antirestriction protein ArdC
MNVYEIVTNRIIEQLEKNVIPWRKPWKGGLPINYVTRKMYQGINQLLLPYGGEYLSYKQAIDAGGNVKKGEKAHIVVFWKMLDTVNKDTGEKEQIPFLRYSSVFHIDQCEGIKSLLEPIQLNTNIKPIDAAENVLTKYIKYSGITYNAVTGCNSAGYDPTSDTITIPVINQFNNPSEYYSTAFHECAHSTGHVSRLNRLSKPAAFGSEIYSKEELTAEISAAMLMNIVNIELPETFENSVAYINNWMKRLREDSKIIVTAAGAAQKAVNLITGNLQLTEEAI